MFYPGIYFLQWQLMLRGDTSVSEDQIFILFWQCLNQLTLTILMILSLENFEQREISLKGLHNLEFCSLV